jgi:hypothetical protein
VDGMLQFVHPGLTTRHVSARQVGEAAVDSS